MTTSTEDLIERNDVDELLREIQRLCSRREWSALLNLVDLCRSAVRRGKQLWGVASYGEYRLCLEADTSICAPLLGRDGGPFSFGPLSEVIAYSHSWDELEPHIEDGPWASATAYERVIRGEDLTSNARVKTYFDTYEIPAGVAWWEPNYVTAEYGANKASFPFPSIDLSLNDPLVIAPTVPSANATLHDTELSSAFHNVVASWTQSGDMRAKVVQVEGDLSAALGALGVRQSATLHRLSTKDALNMLAWASASGAEHGNRRGMAHARASVWWLIAAIVDMIDEWPIEPDFLGEMANSIEWWTWQLPEHKTSETLGSGWALRIIAVDALNDFACGLATFASARVNA